MGNSIWLAPRFALMPGKAAPVAGVRQGPFGPGPQVELAGNPPSDEYPESRPPERGFPFASNFGDAKSAMVAPAVMAQLIAPAEKPPGQPNCAVVRAMAFRAAVRLKKRASPT